MSCEIVLLPMIASTLANSVWLKSSIDAHRQAARQAAAEQQAKLEAWQKFKQIKQQQLQQLQADQQAAQDLHRQFETINLQTIQQKQHVTIANAQGFLNTPQHQQQLETLDTIAQHLQALPNSFHSEQSPLPQLLQQLQTLQQQATQFQLDNMSIDTFKTTVTNTLANYQNDLNTALDYQQQALTQIETCLHNILTYQQLATQQLATHAPEKAALNALQTQLTTALQQGEITPAALQLLEKQTQQIIETINSQLNQQLIQTKLTQTIHHSLENMGYTSRQDFTRTGNAYQAQLDIPGGEQVDIVLHHNNQLACQVQHQRAYDDGSDLSTIEQAQLQAQEARWCEDVQTLIRDLTAEGFEYEIKFERFYPMASVPIVVVEEMADIVQQTHTRSLDDQN